MKIKISYLILPLLLVLASCSINKNRTANLSTKTELNNNGQRVTNKKIEPNDSTFVNLKDFSQDFVLDMKYATTDNFLKEKVYDCPECILRYKTIKALLSANNSFIKKGYRIKIYDCYRPLEIQKKMWKIVSNPEYVANPKKGSIHNRGGAVDISLVDKNGFEINMGTTFDYFGPEASHNYLGLSKEIVENRKLLKKIMIKNHFLSFDSEWWHYNLKNAKIDPISNQKWNCN